MMRGFACLTGTGSAEILRGFNTVLKQLEFRMGFRGFWRQGAFGIFLWQRAGALGVAFTDASFASRGREVFAKYCGHDARWVRGSQKSLCNERPRRLITARLARLREL